MKISLIAALAKNSVIGKGGALPWQLPDDLSSFRRLTTGHCIAMGRKTFDSIEHPLPKRTNIVITRDATRAIAGAVVVGSFGAAVDAARERDEEELFVVGGAEIYSLALQHADHLYLTRVDATPEGDVHFPDFDEADWKLTGEKLHPKDARHDHAFSFQQWRRRSR